MSTDPGRSPGGRGCARRWPLAAWRGRLVRLVGSLLPRLSVAVAGGQYARSASSNCNARASRDSRASVRLSMPMTLRPPRRRWEGLPLPGTTDTPLRASRPVSLMGAPERTSMVHPSGSSRTSAVAWRRLLTGVDGADRTWLGRSARAHLRRHRRCRPTGAVMLVLALVAALVLIVRIRAPHLTRCTHTAPVPQRVGRSRRRLAAAPAAPAGQSGDEVDRRCQDDRPEQEGKQRLTKPRRAHGWRFQVGV